jgi:hypothetical protein
MSLGPDRLPTVLEWLRRQDLPARPLSGPRLEAAPLAGFWVGADRRTTSVDSMDITERDGVCLLRVAGGDTTAPRDWGIVEATPHAADVDGSIAIGATARYDFGFLETTLTFFMKSGILILCTFNRWQDGSARADCFTREFLYRRTRDGGRTSAAGMVTAGITRGNDRPAGSIEGHSAPQRSPRVDPSPIAGRFRSCDQSTLGFTEITVVPGDRDIELTLSAAGGSLLDPGRPGQVIPVRGAAFGDGVHGGPAVGFLAESESSFQRLVLAAYLTKGLLAIDTFTTFLDSSGRSAYRARDHFYRVG